MYMQQHKSWGVMLSKHMAFILVTLFAVGLAFGQTSQNRRIDVPYPSRAQYANAISPWPPVSAR